MNGSFRYIIDKLGSHLDVTFFPYGSGRMSYKNLSGILEVESRYGEAGKYLNSAQICINFLSGKDVHQLMDYNICLITLDSNNIRVIAHEVRLNRVCPQQLTQLIFFHSVLNLRKFPKSISITA